MKYLLIISSIIVCSYQSHAQKTVDSQERYVAVKWAVQSLLWPGNFIQLGIEKRVGKYAGQLQMGLGMPYKYTIQDTVNNFDNSFSGTHRGFTVRAEIRKYRSPVQKYRNANFFWAIEAFYTKYDTPGSGLFVDSGRTINPYYDEYLLQKSMYGAALKAGVQQRFWKHFMIEFYLGIGVKVKTVKQQGIYDITQIRDNHHSFDGPTLGTEATLAAPLNFCIGYYF